MILARAKRVYIRLVQQCLLRAYAYVLQALFQDVKKTAECLVCIFIFIVTKS
jgi:hypothetical protein